MEKAQIIKLVEMSFKENALDAKSVNKIISQLNGKELREYLKTLTEHEKKLNVYIDHSFELSSADKKKFEKLFPGRKMVFRKDTNLIFGLRISDNDTVIDLNMKNAFDQISGHLNRL